MANVAGTAVIATAVAIICVLTVVVRSAFMVFIFTHRGYVK